MPGDVAVFMFSGHGSQVTDFDGDEEDGLDEVICPWDHDWSRVETWFIDDILGNMLDRISHANVMVVIDSCHAGTMTRGADPDEEFGTMGMDSGFLPRPTTQPTGGGGGGGTYIPKPPPRPWEPTPVPFDLTEQGQEFNKAFPDPSRPRDTGTGWPPVAPTRPDSSSFVPDTASRFDAAENRRLQQLQREIREMRQNLPPQQRDSPISGGWDLLEAVTSIRYTAPQQQRLRQELQTLPDSGQVLRSVDKILRPNDSEPISDTDWKVIKGAEEFMRQKNTFAPEMIEAMELFGTLTKATIHRHPLLNPPGSQVLLAATTSDRLSWFSHKDGSFFLTALEKEAARLTDTSTFSDWIGSLQAGVEKAAREASNKFASSDHDPNDPKNHQKPNLEGDGSARVLDFLRGFPAEFRPVSEDAPMPPPEPVRPAWQSQSGDIALTLATDKQTYTEGDLVRVSVAADLDCHLRLFYLSAEHEIHQLFPNQYQPDTAVRKGVTYSFGGEGDAFKLRARPPYGNEILMAVASSRPFTDKESREVQDQLFQEFKNTNLEALGHRGLGVEPGETLLTGRALHLYRVEARK